MNTTTPPTADWVTLDDLYNDPFTIYARLRAESPVAYIPAAGRYFVTRYHDVHHVDNHPDDFTANETNSLMKRSMGHSMLRKDDPEHATERASYGNVLKPKAIKDTWAEAFQKTFDTYFEHYIAQGSGTDFITHFAAPFAAENLRLVMGFKNATADDLVRWSQTLIDATGNYADDASVWAAGETSYHEVNTALDEMIAHYRQHPDASLISHIVHADQAISLEATRANIKMSIGGGVNEPRDALGTAIWALLQNPQQLATVQANPARYKDAFEESVRWVAPIGMYPRQTTRELELGGVTLPAGARLGVCALSANRDETVFENADTFDIDREKKPHLGFGGGTHFCAGAWVARAQVAQIALPQLFQRLEGLSLSETQPARSGGWVFRGLLELPLTWRGVRNL